MIESEGTDVRSGSIHRRHWGVLTLRSRDLHRGNNAVMNRLAVSGLVVMGGCLGIFAGVVLGMTIGMLLH
jgi:hypothetical protein